MRAQNENHLESQKVFDLWEAIPLHSTNASGDFTPREFVAALHHFKLGKAPGSDFICPELVTQAGANLKS